MNPMPIRSGSLRQFRSAENWHNAKAFGLLGKAMRQFLAVET
jgi:hypothetical protein